MRLSLWMTFLLLSLGATAAAQDRPMRITLEAGEVARHNSPVTARLDLPRRLSEHAAVKLVSPEGEVPAQIEPDGSEAIILRWIEPDLPAGKRKSYELILSSRQTEGEQFIFEDGDGFRELRFGPRGAWRHMNRWDPADRENTYKPYHHVFSFHDDGFITKGPGGQHSHHRGIFFGFRTPLGDFWHCQEVRQEHSGYLKEREFAGPIAARSASTTEWIDKDERAVVRDTREITAWHIAPDHLVLDIDVTVENLTDQPIALGGDAHHAGLHFRAGQEVEDAEKAKSETDVASYLRPTSAREMSKDIWADCPWVHATFNIRGKRYAVTHMDAPENPRPTTYSTRAYGRFGAFFPHDLKSDEPLRVRYRIVVRDGETPMSPEQLAQEYADYVSPPNLSPLPPGEG